MMVKKVGIVFSRDFSGITPLGHIGAKYPVYERLLELCASQGWETYVLTRKTYNGNGIFKGVWRFKNREYIQIFEPVKLDLVYDRTGGISFPIPDDNLLVVNEREFKILAWDKWATSKLIGEYTPQTFIIDDKKELPKILSQIKSDLAVLKPLNGLKGLGIFIGSKQEALSFKFDEKYSHYIAQEFIDTSGGIPGIAPGTHDLRVVIVNGKPVWCHVRVPASGSLLANAAQGGSLTEIDYERVPTSIKKAVNEVSSVFSERFNNPIYSLDFGVDKTGKPRIFEINDQMGFPKWEMKNRDVFLQALIKSFKSKLNQ